MEGDYLGDIVQTDAEAFDIVDIAGGDPVELFEDMLLVLFGDADAVVGDY